MGRSVTMLKMSPHRQLIILCLATAIQQATSLFFGAQSSQCRSDSECPSFGRSECLGTNFLLCFGKSRRYTVSGRCNIRTNIFCGVGNLLNGKRRDRDCSYGVCAQCLINTDCHGYNQICSGNTCQTRVQRTTTFRPNYNTPNPNNPFNTDYNSFWNELNSNSRG